MDFDALFSPPGFLPGYYHLEDRVSDGKSFNVRDPRLVASVRFSLIFYYKETSEPWLRKQTKRILATV